MMQGIDVFAKEYLLIPVQPASDWELCIVWRPGCPDSRCFLHLQSTASKPSQSVTILAKVTVLH